MHLTRARRLGWLAAGLGGFVLLLVGALFAVAWSGVQASVTERHHQALEGVFDALDRALAARITREDARPFLEYRYLYVPFDNANPAVVRSPLSRTPDDPAIRAFFSLDPDGTFRSPSTPRGNELDYVQAKGWQAGPSPDAALELLVRALPPAGGAGVRQAVPARALAAEGGNVWNQAVQVVNTKRYNLDAFTDATNSFVPGSDADRDVTVEVRPFRGLLRGDDLVLVREVVAEGRTFRQGLVLDATRLRDEVSAAALAEAGLDGAVTLAWDGSTPPGQWVRSHGFPAPLQDLRVVAGIVEVPALVGTTRSAVRALGGVLALVLVGGGLAVARGVQVELVFAERRTNFVSAVTHELKTPLTTIRMYAEMLRDGMVPEDRREGYLTTMVSESDRLGRLVGNVLTLGQLEQGTAAPVLVVGDAAAVVDEALALVRPHATLAGVTLEVVAAPDLPPVTFDRDALIQVVVNLTDNAVKFAASGGRVRYTLRREGSGVALSVRDHGPGVPTEQLGLVFEPFWRGERELVRRTRGTGIGLTLVRGLAQGMGGVVTARNAAGGGFEVEVTLAGA